MGSVRLPERLEDDFLDAVASGGSVIVAARATGTHRNTWYERARRDPDFRARWDAALEEARRAISDELVEKAMAATGEVVLEYEADPATGAPVLDDDFEPVVRRRLVGYDGQILKTMINKFVRSTDAAQTVSIQNNTQVNATPVAGPPLDVEAILAEYEEAEDD